MYKLTDSIWQLLIKTAAILFKVV